MPDTGLADGDGGQETEKDLSEATVDDGVVDFVLQHPDASKDALDDHEQEDNEAHPAHPAAAIHTPDPDRQCEGKVTDNHAQQSVPVLGGHRGVLGPALRIERAVRERPVRKYHAGTDRCGEAARVEKKQRNNERAKTIAR